MMENKEFDIWLKEFIKKHTAKGSHRWAFWVEGILIGLLIGAIL